MNQQTSKKKVVFPKKKSKSSNGRYFTEVEERAVVEYLTIIDQRRREELFENIIYPSFCKLIENIIFVYKLYRCDMDMRTLRDDAMSFLVMKMDRFTPGGKGRAFSYYGTTIKHYLMQNTNKVNRLSNIYSDVDELTEDAKIDNELYYRIDDCVFEDIKCFQSIVNELYWFAERNSDNKSINSVVQSLIYILKNYEQFAIYKKLQLYYLLREMTNCSTKEVTMVMHQVRALYDDLRKHVEVI